MRTDHQDAPPWPVSAFAAGDKTGEQEQHGTETSKVTHERSDPEYLVCFNVEGRVFARELIGAAR
jgi:hypothetical protein